MSKSRPIFAMPYCIAMLYVWIAGEVEFPEFIQIMTMTKEAEEAASFWGDLLPHAKQTEGVFCILITDNSAPLSKDPMPYCSSREARLFDCLSVTKQSPAAGALEP